METQRLKVVAINAIEFAMENSNLGIDEIAKRLNKERDYVENLLDGETGITLESLVELGLACNVRWRLVGVDASNESKVIVS